MANEKISIKSAVFSLLFFSAILWASWKLSGDGKPTKVVFEEARSSLHKGDFVGAIAGFTQVIESDPNFSIAYDDRAIAERELKQYDKAISDCQRAIEVNRRDYFAFLQRGLSEHVEGDLEGAIVDYLQAVRLNPTNSYAFDEMGVVDCSLSNYGEAVVCLTRAIELNPTNSMYYNDRGWAEFLNGDFHSSMADATRSIQLDPNCGYAYGTRGWARFGNGEISGAVEDCKRSTQLYEPNSAPFFCDRGLLDFIAKDYKKATADWQNAIEKESDLKGELLPWIEKAQGFAHTNNSVCQ